MDHDSSRLLPRFRVGGLLEQHRMVRGQTAALTDQMAQDENANRPLRHELTKPGDRIALRGVPLVGAAAGAIWETAPHTETERRMMRAYRLRERTTY